MSAMNLPLVSLLVMLMPAHFDPPRILLVGWCLQAYDLEKTGYFDLHEYIGLYVFVSNCK